MAKRTCISAAGLKKALGPEFEKMVQDVAEAVHQAPGGAVIAGSEYQVRDLLARFRQTVYEKAVQMRADAAASVIGFGAGRPETMAWIEAASKAALEEGVAGLLVKIRETVRPVRSSAKREAFKKLEQYVAHHAEMLDYPRYRAQGFDIGSGPTESLCRTLPARLKGGGKRWNTPNAEALMALAALKHSRLWHDYWATQLRKAG